MNSRSRILGILVTSMVLQAANAEVHVQWPVESGGIGHWYTFVPGSFSNWPEASAYVSSELGGHLITFASVADISPYRIYRKQYTNEKEKNEAGS